MPFEGCEAYFVGIGRCLARPAVALRAVHLRFEVRAVSTM